MKRTQLIEWGIVTLGLILGYKFFASLFSSIIQIIYEFQGDGMWRYLLPVIMTTAIYGAGFILLIRKSNKIAIYLNGNSADDIIPIKIGRRALLHVILIGICITTIVSHIGDILLYLFEVFKREIGRRNFDDPARTMVTKYRFTISAIQVIIGFAILYFSKTISGWFIKDNDTDEPSFDSSHQN